MLACVARDAILAGMLARVARGLIFAGLIMAFDFLSILFCFASFFALAANFFALLAAFFAAEASFLAAEAAFRLSRVSCSVRNAAITGDDVKISELRFLRPRFDSFRSGAFGNGRIDFKDAFKSSALKFDASLLVSPRHVSF